MEQGSSRVCAPTAPAPRDDFLGHRVPQPKKEYKSLLPELVMGAEGQWGARAGQLRFLYQPVSKSICLRMCP